MQNSKLSKKYNPVEVEERIYQFWEKGGFFKAQISPKRKPFVIALPPPNVTGSLHMGHALNGTLQDILIRRSRMEGTPTLWIPGTDHAGIATQNVVEKELKKEGLSAGEAGKTRFDLGREKFIKRVWQWVDKYGQEINRQFKKIGCSLDWSRARFTLDDTYVTAVEEAFKHYFQKGWIYQGERVINWCPRCQTSLSDLELEHRDIRGKLYYIKYGPVTVATTRPETMLGDVAVAVNPKDKRYKDLIGQKITLPLVGKKLEIIADDAVDPKFGTGAVKVTPAHDLVDFEIALRQAQGKAQRYELKPVKIMDEEGKIVAPAPAKYRGLDHFEGRKRVLEDLEKEGLLDKVLDYKTSMPHCYRCGTVVEPLLSKQWFLKMAELKKPAISAVKEGKIKFIPQSFTKAYLDWMENLKDWNISRQIWWGHRLPVWQPKSKIKNQKLEVNYYVGDNPPEGYEQVEDVLDTWFSSALWPFAALGWPNSKIKNQKSKVKMTNQNLKLSDYDYFFPTTVLSTARDIIFLWVARMIFSSLELTGKIPFEKVYIHPTVLNIKGQRMSKSLGTGVDPLELIEKYGADATRFGLCYQTTGLQDMRFSEEAVVSGRNFANKTWNIARFILINLENPKSKIQISNKIQNPNPKTEADKKIIKELELTIKSVNQNLDNFQFGQAAHTIYDFTWHQLADIYLEKSKEQLKDSKLKKNTQEILLYVLVISLKLLHPFMPYLTEEIWDNLPILDKKPLIISEWPK